MNYVKQAFGISAEMKERAVEIYKQSAAKLCRKDYPCTYYDAHTELSAIFGQEWLRQTAGGFESFFDAEKYAEANTAFNYANFHFATNGRFVAFAKSIVPADEILDDVTLAEMQIDMDCYLTATVPRQHQWHRFEVVI